ncbi:hypothetical protein C9I49_22180 [Pseudomonas prosekii]|uniref:Uncharacterized protein n=1 Tax=Pseudomonas prosekii TaxID=1148509 RepID=A0A2U2D383_9PSED|nr:hypothetical protein C9I49_22180 [Pseudomonas prosekii]
MKLWLPIIQAYVNSRLKVGKPAVDCQGAFYRITSQYGQLAMVSIGESETTPVAIVSFVTAL